MSRAYFRLSIKWLNHTYYKNLTDLCLLCVKGGGSTYVLTEGLEKLLGHRIQAIFVFFVFCSVEVPTYIFPRKKTKFSPFLNSLPACRNLLFVFFDTLK